MRHTRSHTRNRRSHHALTGKRFVVCPSCGAQQLMHHVCLACGKYKGRQIIDVMAKKTRKLQKKTEARKAKKGTETKSEKEEAKTTK